MAKCPLIYKPVVLALVRDRSLIPDWGNRTLFSTPFSSAVGPTNLLLQLVQWLKRPGFEAYQRLRLLVAWVTEAEKYNWFLYSV